ncbi:MAG: aminodeoxychorismate/anthranilate synthase component II [Kiritimatiellae bacterium]|nr:aminodeoxychorismate/anthranilate synthase component II [Kiritimatiellia bacterium]
MILVLDNYDSFTYNLVQYLREMTADVRVARNDALTVADVLADLPRALVVSPGPGRPEAAGISCELIRALAGRVPILGVCLGHQSIGQVFGARIVHAARLMHGKVSDVTADGLGLYAGIKSPFKAMRYHSLAIARDSLPPELVVTATSEDGEIMGVRHVTHAVEGIQFHPESIMTPIGKRLLRNFVKQADAGA